MPQKSPAGDTIVPVTGTCSTHGAEGYVEEIPYTYGYHADLDPARMRLALRRAGLAPPEVRVACELGYGQGLSLAIHAVAGGARWFGTDLNPAHAAGLGGLVEGTGAALEASAETFAGYFARDDLPCFDFVGAYGVWSWVSARNRERIVGFLQRRLRPGGVFYLSYNALPGWGPMLPLRALLMERVAAAPPHLPLAERIDAALRDTALRLALDPSLEEAHPGIEAELRAIRGKRVGYLAHEFFNRDWAPMHPEEVAAVLRAAGLRFAASADEEGGTRSSADPRSRFRREYWVMGEPRRETAPAALETDAAAPAERLVGCRILNARLLALARQSPDPAWLASPVTGGGVEVGYTTMLLLDAWQRGLREPAALAGEVEATLARLGQRLLRDGEVVVGRADSLRVLEREAREFGAVTLAQLSGLGVV